MGRHRRYLSGRQPNHLRHAGENLFFNCGWGTGGFKGTPGSGNVFAHMLAHGRAHPLAEPFTMNRFYTGALVDEHGAAGVAH